MTGTRVQLLEEFRADPDDAATWVGYVESQTNEAVLIRLGNGDKVWARSDQVELAPLPMEEE